MTMSEFRMWLEGFEESIDGAPTKVQWKKITKKLAEVEPDSYPVHPAPFYPMWERHWTNPYGPHFVYTSPSTGDPLPFIGQTTCIGQPTCDDPNSTDISTLC